MKKMNSWLSALFIAFAIAFSASAQAQHEDFRPYKGICWGMFWDYSMENMFQPLVPIEYVRPTWDRYVLVDFIGCGKDLVINITDVNVDPEYYDIHLEMEDGKYDDYGYFYPPFSAGAYNWTFSAPFDELIGPIHQPSSYYHEPLEYIGLLYVRYPDNYFAYFDIKTQEDYYDDVPRTFIDDEEANLWTGVAQHLSPVKPAEKNLYDLLGRRVNGASKGFLIENGRKVMR